MVRVYLVLVFSVSLNFIRKCFRSFPKTNHIRLTRGVEGLNVSFAAATLEFCGHKAGVFPVELHDRGAEVLYITTQTRRISALGKGG